MTSLEVFKKNSLSAILIKVIRRFIYIIQRFKLMIQIKKMGQGGKVRRFDLWRKKY
jgi:hypothetical protein